MSEKSCSSGPTGGISTRNQPKYAPGEKILCFHGAFLYEAKCLQVEKTRSNEYSYFVHYNGWSKNWDEWVSSKRILKYNEENLNKQKDLIASQNKKSVSSTRPMPSSSPSTTNTNASSSTASTTSGSTSVTSSSVVKVEASVNEEANSKTSTAATVTTTPTTVGATSSASTTAIATPIVSKESSSSSSSSFTPSNTRSIRSTRKTSNEPNSVAPKNEPVEPVVQEPPKKQLCLVDISLMYDIELDSEIAKVKIPHGLQNWLHNDSDFILEQNKIIQLPTTKTVSAVLKDYQEFKHNEKPTNDEDIKQRPFLNETISSLIKYFNTMLGSQLLYKFERLQYKKILENKKQSVSDIYSPIHLLRLMEKLNQVLSCDIDYEQNTFRTLVYYANDILKYMDKNSDRLFDEKDYINPPPFYVRASI